MSEPVCPSCSSEKTRELGAIAPGVSFAGRILDDPIPGGRLYSCDDCLLWFRWPQLTADVLERYYQDATEGHWAAPADDRTDWRLARAWLQDHAEGDRLLDVGCFDGRFLEYMGPGWRRFGVEINAEAADVAKRRSVSILANDVRQIADLDEGFDAVTAFDVIEHVPDPLEMLTTMKRVTKPGGSILIATGNIDAFSWRFMKQHYWYCTIPEHLSFIGTSWVERAAAKLDLSVEHVARYSHDFNDRDRSHFGQIRPAALSVLLKYAPRLFRAMRQAGVGEIDVSKDPDLAMYPPVWTEARDHFLVVLRRSQPVPSSSRVSD